MSTVRNNIMKTLLYTSIYSNLYQTEFGGRASRNIHYKYSLLNLLNMKADKYVCFTSSEEIDDLKRFFYKEHSVSPNVLSFQIFDLKHTKHFNLIRNLKNLDEIKKSDRCYEIQYNKFFWLDYIEDIHLYNKIFWIDAGLSHSGIINQKYSTGTDGISKYYQFSLFNPNLLSKFNQITQDKILLINKNNANQFYWSTTIPEKYYNQYSNTEHIVGGLFGGNNKDIFLLKNKFEELLLQLLNQEKQLYFEELIMSCIYKNNLDMFYCLCFDDWYKRDSHSDNVKLFYEVFL